MQQKAVLKKVKFNVVAISYEKLNISHVNLLQGIALNERDFLVLI